MLFYSNRAIRAKRYWNKILGKMDLYMKHRSIKIWNENAHSKRQFDLENHQNSVINDITEKTKLMGKLTQEELEQKAFIKQQENQRRRKAYRQIGNYFMRNYTTQTNHLFTMWKTNVHEHVHKEKLLKRTFEHMRRNQLESVRRVFNKFLSDERRAEMRAQIKQTMIESEEIAQSIRYNEEMRQKHKAHNKTEMTQETQETDELERKIHHTMECMERRHKNWVYMSRKRMIFLCWRRAVKQQKAFLYCVKNVLEKSMYKKGFVYIAGQNRDIEYTTRVHRALKKFAFRFFQINCSDSMNKWKKACATKVHYNREEKERQLRERMEAFENFVSRSKDVNNERCYKYFLDTRKSNVWRAWLNVVKQFKLTKAKTVEFRER